MQTLVLFARFFLHANQNNNYPCVLYLLCPWTIFWIKFELSTCWIDALNHFFSFATRNAASLLTHSFVYQVVDFNRKHLIDIFFAFVYNYKSIFCAIGCAEYEKLPIYVFCCIWWTNAIAKQLQCVTSIEPLNATNRSAIRVINFPNQTDSVSFHMWFNEIRSIDIDEWLLASFKWVNYVTTNGR